MLELAFFGIALGGALTGIGLYGLMRARWRNLP